VTPHAFARAGAAAGALLTCVLGAAQVASQPAPGAPAPPPAPQGRVWATCVEHLPGDVTRPDVADTFPDRTFAGYAAELRVEVAHGKGATVLPGGFQVESGSEAARALAAAGFVIPQADGGSAPTVETQEREDDALTTLVIPILALPKGPGRHELELPPLPIAIARANGQILTVCTKPHGITVLDPTGNEQDPEVHPNPDPRPQREEWVLLKQLTLGALAGVVAGVLLAWLLRRWLRRPKPPPVVPKRLPWVVALEELAAIRSSSLLAEERTDEYFDRVSDTVRKYLGARYGFDGLETTTHEMRSTLKRVRPPIQNLKDIGVFLEDCDLVKFARMVPAESDCLDALARGEAIVMATTPPKPVDPSARKKPKKKRTKKPPAEVATP
jgi:hypothetical protein